MKSFINTYTSILFLVLATAFSSCEQQLAEPMQTTNTSTEANAKMERFVSGNYIVQYNDSTVQLTTNEDIELLSDQIAGTDITLTDVYNFDGFKGMTCYLTKQQARSFYFDARVLVIELDAPINPAPAKEAAEAQATVLI